MIFCLDFYFCLIISWFDNTKEIIDQSLSQRRIISFHSPLDHFYDIWLMGGSSFLFFHFIEFSQTFLNSHLQIPRNPFLTSIFLVILLKFPVLILKFLDFFLLYPDHNILFLQILLQENIINFISLLHNNQVIVCMSQLTDIVLELH